VNDEPFASVNNAQDLGLPLAGMLGTSAEGLRDRRRSAVKIGMLAMSMEVDK